MDPPFVKELFTKYRSLSQEEILMRGPVNGIKSGRFIIKSLIFNGLLKIIKTPFPEYYHPQSLDLPSLKCIFVVKWMHNLNFNSTNYEKITLISDNASPLAGPFFGGFHDWHLAGIQNDGSPGFSQDGVNCRSLCLYWRGHADNVRFAKR